MSSKSALHDRVGPQFKHSCREIESFTSNPNEMRRKAFVYVHLTRRSFTESLRVHTGLFVCMYICMRACVRVCIQKCPNSTESFRKAGSVKTSLHQPSALPLSNGPLSTKGWIHNDQATSRAADTKIAFLPLQSTCPSFINIYVPK